MKIGDFAMVKRAWIQEQVDQIEANRDDDEVAHSMEDDLYKTVLRAISIYSEDPKSRSWAQTALRAADLQFSRWCA